MALFIAKWRHPFIGFTRSLEYSRIITDTILPDAFGILTYKLKAHISKSLGKRRFDICLS